ncbi:DUF1289 domain-containing protein [Methylotuvimicrobium sp.]|uniref:DUF1289 domain-containing protein n=1 Tax=Methylotuvimicrobium sp. TaxID=2822413 RepID=UPI003D65CDD6
MKKKTPCIDVCKYSGPSEWYIGCGRTQEESRQWKKMKPYAKQALLNSLKKRLSQMNVAK